MEKEGTERSQEMLEKDYQLWVNALIMRTTMGEPNLLNRRKFKTYEG